MSLETPYIDLDRHIPMATFPLKIKAHRPIRRVAKNQVFPKSFTLPKAAAERIAEEGYQQTLQETGSKDLAVRHKMRALRILSKPVWW